ncbi:hypothetical protein DFS34DRAFT_649938 [Phlyctochytrium arcticum]|nr:hypothetical protein DFS34DRAFT_649938 [Phlyctochytrium arcticum]
MHFSRPFLALSALLATIVSAQDTSFTDAELVYTSTPIGDTVWVAGTTVKIAWSILPAHPAAVKTLTIELGTGQNSTVINSGIFVAPAPGLPYPSTVEVDYKVPADLPPRQYCLIFVGRGSNNQAFGPNWATWFTVRAAAAATTVSSVLPTTTASPATLSSSAVPIQSSTLLSDPTPTSAASPSPTRVTSGSDHILSSLSGLAAAIGAAVFAL